MHVLGLLKDYCWIAIRFAFSYIQKSLLKKDIRHLLYMTPTDRKAACMNYLLLNINYISHQTCIYKTGTFWKIQ